MSHPIQLVIEGTGAGPAASELATLTGLTVTTTDPTESATKGDPLTILAEIVTVASILPVVDLIYRWYYDWRQGKADKAIDKVVIIAGKQRLLLENTTKAQLAKILETL